MESTITTTLLQNYPRHSVSNLPTAKHTTQDPIKTIPRLPRKVNMFTSWDLVRPRVWHPLASFEQSMTDFHRMMAEPFGSVFDHEHDDDFDDEFFSDLPVRRRSRPQPSQAQHTQTQSSTQANQTDAANANTNTNTPSRTFSSYAYSNSTIIDDKGQRVTSTRRRYEDSSGRLKAVHERQIGDKRLRSVWNRMNQDDQGQHERTLLSANKQGQVTPEALDEFEVAWKQTAFGAEEEKKKQEVIKEKGEENQTKK